MTDYISKRAVVNGVNLHYIVAGAGPVALGMHGWPQNHREYLPLVEKLASRYCFIVPDLRGYADSDKPFSGYEPKTIAQDMLELLAVECIDKFHIVSHDLGGPPSVALAYMAGDRALSLATIETPFFGLDFPGYVDPRVPYWHLGMHMNMDITTFLIEGREDRYLRHFFRDFAYNPNAVPEEEVERYVMQMRQPGNLRASLNHYGYIPQMTEQTAELTREKLKVPMLAWGGARSFGSHCIDSARAISVSAEGGVIEECGHWVFEEKTDFICQQLEALCRRNGGRETTAPNPIEMTSRSPVAVSGVEHTGITVSSLEEALDFWVNVLGFRHRYSWKFENTPFIEKLVGVPGAAMSLAMVEGYGHSIELLEYQAPADRKVIKPRSCDVGSVHIGLHVEDIDAALARVAEAGWGPVAEPQTVEDGERKGMRLIYARGPDGMTIEFIQNAPAPR
jgi:pimeloyl-ACP methyl ester carboxylesterase/catechol 2,3-dioxygenase-like lactoylglutathione lyase family enzyme